jgi:hypothetical protein
VTLLHLHSTIRSSVRGWDGAPATSSSHRVVNRRPDLLYLGALSLSLITPTPNSRRMFAVTTDDNPPIGNAATPPPPHHVTRPTLSSATTELEHRQTRTSTDFLYASDSDSSEEDDALVSPADGSRATAPAPAPPVLLKVSNYFSLRSCLVRHSWATTSFFTITSIHLSLVQCYNWPTCGWNIQW